MVWVRQHVKTSFPSTPVLKPSAGFFTLDVTQFLNDHATTLAVFDALKQRLAKAGAVLRAPPLAPTTCCGRGCNGCVWEGFYDAANYWRDDALEALQDLENLRLQE